MALTLLHCGLEPILHLENLHNHDLPSCKFPNLQCRPRHDNESLMRRTRSPFHPYRLIPSSRLPCLLDVPNLFGLSSPGLYLKEHLRQTSLPVPQ